MRNNISRQFIILPIAVFFIFVKLYAQNAPISTVVSQTTANNTAIVSLTVTNFQNIGAINIKLGFDSNIATLTNVTAGPALVPQSGGLNFNNTVPGVVNFGWYAYSSANLADGEVMFNLHFTRVNYGITPIYFIDDNNSSSCLFYDSPTYNMLNDSPTANYYIDGTLTFSGGVTSPATTIQSVNACAGVSVDFPVTVTNFSNIGSAFLTILYDENVLSSPSMINTSNVLPLIADMTVPGKIIVSGQSASAVSLIDNSTFFTLSFSYNGGNSALNFDHSLNNNCQYGGPPPLYTPISDFPEAAYYSGGIISEFPAFFFVTDTMICEGETFDWRGSYYTSPGTYIDYGQTVFGCDSNYILNLTVNPVFLLVTDTTIFDNELPFTWENALYHTGGTYFMNYQTNHGCDSILQLNLTVLNNPQLKTLNLIIFLEGLSLGSTSGTMNEAMNISGPQFGPGIADVINVELCDQLNTEIIHYQNLNVMLNIDGSATISDIPAALSGEYYIVIKHRNSIETWSSIPVSFNMSGNINYSFSSMATQAYGSNLKAMSGGYYAIYSGDVNADGVIDGSDLSLIDNAATIFLPGYNSEDVNGDGIIDGSDMMITLNNSTFFVQTIKP